MFYLERARKSKIAAKIFSKLDDISLVDVQTQQQIDEILKKYREMG
jgi:hypothetical protein